MTRGVVPVDQSLAGRTIEQAGRRELLLSAGVRGLSLLERSPQGGTLRTVAHGRRARLTHVLLGGSDIRHEIVSGEENGLKCEAAAEGNNNRCARTREGPRRALETRNGHHESQG